MPKLKPHVIISILSFFSFISTAVIIILIAKGYTINFKDKTVDITGMIIINSEPRGALIYLQNDLQQSVTNATLSNLNPGEYKLQLEKEGFTPWVKSISVQENIVTEINARLFPLNPSLTPITSYGSYSPKSNSEQNKIAFQVRDNDEKNGLWILTFTNIPFGKGYDIESILTDELKSKYSQGDFSWAPDGKEILLSIKLNEVQYSNFLIPTDSTSNQFSGTSKSQEEIISKWKKEQESLNTDKISTLSLKEQKIIEDNKEEISWSRDQKKFYYINDKDNLEFYDLEKKEITISNLNPNEYKNIIWYPDNERLVVLNKSDIDNTGKISIVELDGQNEMSVYSGTIFSSDIFVSPNGKKLFFLTNFNTSTGLYPNLYSISLE